MSQVGSGSGSKLQEPDAGCVVGQALVGPVGAEGEDPGGLQDGLLLGHDGRVGTDNVAEEGELSAWWK